MTGLRPPPIRETLPPGTLPDERRITWASVLGKPSTLGGAGIAIGLSDIPGQIAAVRKFLRSVGTGTVAGVPAWDTLTAADIAAGTFAVGTFAYQGLVDLSAATAGQIKFPAAQHASADPNTLDDYEEGTWTPTDASGAGLVFAAADGLYTKIGRLVIANGRVLYPVTANAASALLGGLPFVTNGNASVSGGGTIGYSKIATLAWLGPDNGATTMEPVDTAGSLLLNSTMSNKPVFFTMMYPV